MVSVADTCRVEGAREIVNPPVDTAAAFARRDGFVTSWHDDGQADWVRGIGADLVRGHGRLDGPRQVAVETGEGGRVVLTAGHAVAICTGSRPALPDLPGIAEVRPWTNREGTDAHVVPGRLAIVGGGGVAVEMSSAWQGLGASVTLLVRGPRSAPVAADGAVCR
ncbi:FAD-dependent oxidoreductase [Saccharopolyspora shandongensis]|uniref:FAD-dependent oxidoreductase n=1 Tax=Saccharopolyspora shandongensis TaxID=418495 RepID=UPI0033D0D5E6